MWYSSRMYEVTTVSRNETDTRHTLSGINDGNLTATCERCGNTKVTSFIRTDNGKTQYRCATAEKAQKRRYYEKNPLKSHGLTPIETQEFIKGKTCAICGTTEDLVIDHDHQTGRIRDTLCRKHNAALGAFDDDPDLLVNALDYLDRFSE